MCNRLVLALSISSVPRLYVQGGNARDLTVIKMRKEIESHALYELTATLARSTGSRRLPKLTPLLSNASALALSRQHTSLQATLQLLQSLSSAAALLAVQPQTHTPVRLVPSQTSSASKCGKGPMKMHGKLSFEPDAVCKMEQPLHGKAEAGCCDSIGRNTDVLSREAMLLSGPGDTRWTSQLHLQQTQQEMQHQHAQKKAVTQLLELSHTRRSTIEPAEMCWGSELTPKQLHQPGLSA